jgi:aminopeptidase N
MSNDLPLTIRLQDYQPPIFFIDSVDLTFELEEESTLVKSVLIVHRNPKSLGFKTELSLVGEALKLEALSLNGQNLQSPDFLVTDKALVIHNVPDVFELIIKTRIKPHENTSLSGLYQSNGNFCTQCEAQGFRRITYFLDRPDVMARYTTTIIADKTRYPILLSNGNLKGTGLAEGNKHWARWEDPYKKPCYLFALVAGQLDFIEDYFVTQSGRKVQLRIYVEKGNTDKCAHAMQAVKKAMCWDEIRFGLEYDLDIYMIVAVSDFNMGAMENKGLNIFNTKYILANPATATDEDFINVESVIAHEYFHNWTGNRVTCRDWFQLSLKEGLTIFRDQSFTADTTSKTVARIHDVNALRMQQFPEDNGPLAHPVRPESYIEINNFYTATVYNKGAEVIRMMQTIIGEKVFRRGMDLYFERHDGQAVTINDFVAAMQDASGLDLTQFTLWYSQAGTPIVTVTDFYDITKKVYSLTLEQQCPATPGQPIKQAMHIPISIGLFAENGKEYKLESSLLHLTQIRQTFIFENIDKKPIPSLLRHFSAPIKIKYEYSEAALRMLFQHDTDAFNRWEAGQKYAIHLLLQLVKIYQKQQEFTVPHAYLQAFKHVLLHQQQDKLLLAEMLTLPSEKYIAEQMQIVDVEAIHAAREYLLNSIATYMKHEFLEMYQQNHDAANQYQFTMEEVGKRQLKNLCLSYLMLLPDAIIHERIGMQQFKQELAYNMTDTMAALRSLVNSQSPWREQALTAFYEKWQNEALVVDKWFAIQAAAKLPGTLNEVKKLLRHPAFDLKNPNKVYSLIGTFGTSNPINFHDENGEGYAFLAAIVAELDAINPQVAARMVKPLTGWRRYDVKRQALMCAQLELIAKNKHISPDVYELVSKSLV